MRNFYELFDQFCVEYASFFSALILFSLFFFMFVCFFVDFKSVVFSKGVLLLICFSFLLAIHYYLSFMYIITYTLIFFAFFYSFSSLSLRNGLNKLSFTNIFSIWSSVIKKNIMFNIEGYVFLLVELWVLLCVLNLVGMMPFSFAVTTQIIFPFFISLSLFIFNNLVGWMCYRFKIFNLFLPKDVPLFITPLLVMVEYISYFARIFSLSIRLCANMLSIHILLKILIGFTFLLGAFTIYAHLLYSLILSIFFLDISACILQGYIFVFLSLVYMSNIIIMH